MKNDPPEDDIDSQGANSITDLEESNCGIGESEGRPNERDESEEDWEGAENSYMVGGVGQPFSEQRKSKVMNTSRL